MIRPTLHHFGQVIQHDNPPTSLPPKGPGHCTLLDAGSGDPDLLTVKAVKTIQTATMLLVDDQVSDAVLALATPSARVLRVGKRNASQATPQAFIEKIIIMAVSEGEQVVHLKGGDPFVWGRSSEEITHLRAAGVSVSVGEVPQGFLALKLSQNQPQTRH